MSDRKTVLHIIDSLGRGGAETLLVGVVTATPEFDHIIVSLKPINEFKNELSSFKIYFLNIKWYHSIPKIVYQIKKIVANNKIDVIHAHLFWSVIVSRLACPRNIKLINSYHAVLYGKKGGKYPFYARLIDKLTYFDKVITLCVSNQVLQNIKENVGIKQNVHVLHNFIADAFYESSRPAQKVHNELKLVAVGNLKKDKNYEIILDAFAELNVFFKDKISLDIYGKGPLLEDLRNKCQLKNIQNVHLKGSVNNVSAILPIYDVYLISSTSEGFGLAVVEAMAIGLPVVVSDIPTLREVTGENALFFNPFSVSDLADKIKAILNDKVELQPLAKRGHEFSKRYSKEAYLKKLTGFYLN